MSVIVLGDLLYNVVVNPASLSALNIILAETTNTMRATSTAGRAMNKVFAAMDVSATTTVGTLTALGAAATGAGTAVAGTGASIAAPTAALDALQLALNGAIARIAALEAGLAAPIAPANGLAATLERVSLTAGGAVRNSSARPACTTPERRSSSPISVSLPPWKTGVLA